MPDDKFLDYYINMSEKFSPNNSSYVVFSETQNLKFIKSDNPNLIQINNLKQSYIELAKYTENVSVIIFHSFVDLHYEFVNNLDKNIIKVWIFWGHEGYGAIPSSSYTSLRSSKLLFPKSINGILSFWKEYLLSYTLTKQNKLRRLLIKKMDYCATWVDGDQKLAKKINKQIQKLYFCYYTRELMNFERLNVMTINRDRIFLGNSGNHSNNHIEALNFLYENNFSGEIICPLSYSGSEIYVKAIIEKGKTMFGDRFIPLLDFIPLQEYQEIINSCGIVWMNHFRQQAAGNLFAAFCSGKLVVLNDKNPMQQTFKKWGLYFVTSNELFLSNDLDIKSIGNNRDIILEKVTIDANKHFFEEILKLNDLRI